ncbi:MAG: MarR family transcriptional regulator [Bacteroidota bacterium]
MMKKFDPDFIGRWIGMSAHRMAHFITKSMHANNFSITHEQLVILKIMSCNEGISQKELAEKLDRDKTSIARSITILEKDHKVVRINNQDDKRINSLYLTKEGKELLDELQPIFENLKNEIQEGFTDEEIKNVVSFLKKITDRLTEMESKL